LTHSAKKKFSKKNNLKEKSFKLKCIKLAKPIKEKTGKMFQLAPHKK
jgi:hypothetical protein